MVFAAGLGTRMGALTRDRPKPLLAVGGRPLIDHALALVRDAGIAPDRRQHPRPPRADARASRPRRARRAGLPRARAAGDRRRAEAGAAAARRRAGLHAERRHGLDRAEPARRARRGLAAGRRARCWRWCRAPRRSGTAAPATSFAIRRPGASPAAATPPPPTSSMPAPGSSTPRRSTASPRRSSRSTAVWDRLRAEGRLRGIVHPGGWVDVGRPEGIALAEAELAR